MDENTIMKGILNSYPYPIVFIDNEYIIRFMNKNARYHYYEERGYKDLIGKSLFACHTTEASVNAIKNAYEKMKVDGKEVFIGVSLRNQRIYMQCVRDENGLPIGFIERFELNLEK